MQERAVFYHVVEFGVHSLWNMKYVYMKTLLLHDPDEAYYTLNFVFTVYTS